MSVTPRTNTDLLSTARPEWDEDPLTKTLRAYPDQEPFLSAASRYHAFISGIGAGKTNALVQRILLNVHYWNPGETGMVVLPTVPSLRNVLIPELRKWNVLNTCDYQPSKNTLVWPNDSRVILESADNDRKIQRLRGPSIAWGGIDEPASIDRRAWEILIGRLRTGQYRNAFVTGTPKGYNWVFDRFHPDGDDYTPDVNAVLNVPTTANPHTPEDYKTEIVQEYGGSFYEQEVLGSFVKFEGLVYGWFGDSHTFAPTERPDVASFDRIIYGVDWGFGNPSVILAVGVRGDQYVVLEEFYERRCTTPELIDIAHEMQSRYAPGTFYCDPSEPEDIEEFDQAGLDARKAKNDVTPGIRKLTEKGSNNDLLVTSSAQSLINEFGQYQFKDADDSDEPIKKNDHALDALRYAVFTHENPGTKKLNPVF